LIENGTVRKLGCGLYSYVYLSGTGRTGAVLGASGSRSWLTALLWWARASRGLSGWPFRPHDLCLWWLWWHLCLRASYSKISVCSDV